MNIENRSVLAVFEKAKSFLHEIVYFLGPCTGGLVDGCGSKKQVQGKVSSFG